MSEISRRRLLQGSAAAAAGLAVASCSGATPLTTPARSTGPARRTPRPNVVLIVSDDIGYSDLGCFGGEIPTPALDRLAAGGRRFTQMLTNPMCCPSRAALLTGLYPTQAGVGYNTSDAGRPGYVGHLNDDCATLAEVLGAAGYRTAISGKWHVSNWRTPSAEPPARGFDRSFCMVGGNGYFTTDRFLDGKLIGPSSDPDFYATEAITSFADDRIREFHGGGDPFFLYVGYTAPHFPLQAPAAAIAPFHGRYRQGWDAVRRARYARAQQLGILDPAWRLSPRAPGVPAWTAAPNHDWESARMEVYAAQVRLMDAGIGRLVETLEILGIRDDTLVLFLGDNGASAESIDVGSHSDAVTRNGRPMRSGDVPSIFPGPSDTFCSYGRPWGNVSAAPFRRYKLWVEEGGISTPLIASWPGVLPQGGIDHRTLHLMDVMPTLADLCHAAYPSSRAGHAVPPAEGVSFAPVLAGDVGAAAPDRWLFWEFTGHRAARFGSWKVLNDRESGPWSLYDMATDRTELVDLADRHPDLVTHMASEWTAWKQRVGVATWSPTTGYRPS